MQSVQYEVRTVASDLEYLASVYRADPNLDELRREAVVLRRLLNEGDFKAAWAKNGFDGSPQILAPDLDAYLAASRDRSIAFTQAGGGNYRGVSVALEIGDGRPKGQQNGPEERPFEIHEYTESACILWNGILVSRRRLVWYVANKLGSAHLDMRRKWSGKIGKELHALDRMNEEFFEHGARPGHMNPVFHELLCIGQAVCQSPDTRRFLDDVGRQTRRRR